MPHTISPEMFWTHSPKSIKEALALCSTGQYRLLQILSAALERMNTTAEAVAIPILADIALAAWEESPFDTEASKILLHIHSQYPFLSTPAMRLARQASHFPEAGKDVAVALGEHIKTGNAHMLKQTLEKLQSYDERTLYWIRFASHLGLYAHESEWFEQYVNKIGSIACEFTDALRADIHFGREEWDTAAKLYMNAYKTSKLPSLLVKAGECHLRNHSRERAMQLWQTVLRQRPWQSNLLLRYTDLLEKADIPTQIPAGKGVILLYSWNHADDLQETLRTLFQSETGETPVLLINNGCTDHSADIIASWEKQVSSQLRVITLPVNIGAPAARNWLLSDPEVRAADWVVFLDDDVLLPANWLQYFGTALQLHSNAEIVGCCVQDKVAPLVCQSADLHLESPLINELEQHSNNTFNLTTYHTDSPHFGQFGYMRPSVSVTGCVHLIRQTSIQQTGRFDIRFSPSQFDDLDRDLRSTLAGSLPLYQGHLRITHCKRSGFGAKTSAWQAANINGNSIKLLQSYSAEQRTAMYETDMNALLADMARRAQLLTAHNADTDSLY